MNSNGLNIKQGEDFSSVPIPESVTKGRIRYDIWEFSRKDSKQTYSLSNLSASGLLELLELNGFFKLESGSTTFVHDSDSVIENASLNTIQEFMREYLRSISSSGISFTFEGERIKATCRNLQDVYLRQNHLTLNERQLGHLTVLPKQILRDKPGNAFFPFQNGIVSVTENGLKLIPYSELENTCVWKDSIIEHQFVQIKDRIECDMVKFLQNVTEECPERYSAMKSGIGYLLHGYTRPSSGRVIILYDQTITDPDSPQGGTGKGIIANAIRQLIPVTKIDGKRFDPGDRFCLQLVKRPDRVVWLDDVKPTFPFEFLFSAITDGMTVEKKNQVAFVFKPEYSPKILICSNTVLGCDGNSNQRRQYVIELSGYYSSQFANGVEEPIIKEHGREFFGKTDWDEKEWNAFYNFMIGCCIHYLQNGLVPYKRINVASNRLMQKTNQEFFEWVIAQDFATEQAYETKEIFQEFRNLYYGEESPLAQRTFTKWLKAFAQSKGWRHSVSRSGNKQYFTFSVA